MKKHLRIFLLLLCVAFVAVGLRGLLHGDRSRQIPEHSREVQTSSSVHTTSFGDMLNVKGKESSGSRIKDYAGFRLSFNSSNHTPDWVAWELLGSETQGNESRYKKFWQDNDLTGCPQTSDYSNSGYDRGHLCPSADQKWSPEAMRDCFSMANIAPQEKALNTGAWKTLENKERVWARRDSAIIIVAGPIYSSQDTKRIGKTGIRVPGAFFKVMIAPYIDSPRGIAFVYPNMTAPGNMENYVMTIREVENLTGLDFFSSLPDELEERLETRSSFQDWNRNR